MLIPLQPCVLTSVEAAPGGPRRESGKGVTLNKSVECEGEKGSSEPRRIVAPAFGG